MPGNVKIVGIVRQQHDHPMEISFLGNYVRDLFAERRYIDGAQQLRGDLGKTFDLPVQRMFAMARRLRGD